MASASLYRCVFITGASSGLGAEFARQLAPVSEVLVLVARRVELLESLATELEAGSLGVQVHCLQADLTRIDQREGVLDSIRSLKLEPDLLINNAGIGDYGEFSSSDWQKVESMMRINMEALTHLTHSLLAGMIKQGAGSIINVSSLASILAIP